MWYENVADETKSYRVNLVPLDHPPQIKKEKKR